MKKLLLIFILLFPHRGLGGFLYAQGDFTRIYHPIINEAELAIVDTNYFEALNFYKEAFANVKKPFAKDYYNAAICAAMIGKLSLTFDYLEKIVEKGYPSDSLRKDVFFHYVADTCKRWSDFEKQMKLVKPNINWEVRDSLKSYYALATKIVYTPLTPELRKFITENTKRQEKIKDTLITFTQVLLADSMYFSSAMPEKLKNQQDSIRKINDSKYSANAKIAFEKTVNLIETNGFPDETMIGLSGFDVRFSRPYRNFVIYEQDFNLSLLDKNLTINILGNSPFTYRKEFLPTLIQAIRDGKLIPHQINRIDFSIFNTTTKNFENNFSYFTMGRVQVLQLHTEVEINEKRQDIGLEKLADAYKKAFFKANLTPFIINGGRYQKELSYISSCEVLEKTLKESIIVR
jgi:tetratricopeptide (TPR) repeat protein